MGQMLHRVSCSQLGGGVAGQSRHTAKFVGGKNCRMLMGKGVLWGLGLTRKGQILSPP